LSFPRSVTVDPSGKFAYVVNDGSHDVSAYTINVATGALTGIGSTPVAAGTNPQSITTTGTIQ
jgi:6-phosphogluconolactonase (cycloisomerase 2 family)